MKHLIMKDIAVFCGAALVFGSFSFSASADASPNGIAALLNQPRETMLANIGFSPDQIEAIENTNIVPSQYIVYFNLPSSIVLPANTIVTVAVEHSEANITYDGLKRGIGVSVPSPLNEYYPYEYNDGDDYCFDMMLTTFTHTDADFPNIVRAKYTGNPPEFTLQVVSGYNNSYVSQQVDSGYVEAGNITKYITDSTDTASVINDDDAYRLFYHAARLVAELPDPDWTDKATVAGDLNFDNQITAADSQILYNALANETDLW